MTPTTTAIQELIKHIEGRMAMFKDDDLLPSERGAYDAYFNVLKVAKAKLNHEKNNHEHTAIWAMNFALDNLGKVVKSGEEFNKYYNNTYKQP